ncbi:MAG: serine protease [Dehalococcoidia bacterium]
MRSRWLPAILALLALLAFAACSGGGDDDDDDTESPTPTENDEPVAISELAHAVVQIQALLDDEPVWWGSGTLISKDGLILTNAHVVDNRNEEYEQLGIAITDQSDEPPDLQFHGEVLAVDYSLDLAVVQITEEIDGGNVLEDFPFVAIGDSDQVDIGDSIRILGYPGIGGETITFTNGVISGFTAERSVGNRAWIKTDATIAGGNSGGLAINADGEIIGVPTVVGSGAGETAGFVDCRVLVDTNNDGFLDDSDNCVPVGGFINGVRPVKLAQDLISAAEDGDEYVSPYYDEQEIEETPRGGFDTTDTDFTNLVFADGVTDDDEPTDIVVVVPSASERLCGFWEYEAMADGMTWDAYWYVDGAVSDEGSIVSDTWVGGESGSWWVCILGQEGGLSDGLYELILQVEGEVLASDAIFVGDDHAEVELDISNESSVEICAAWVSPTGAQNWGTEDLGATVTIPPGELAPVFLGSGTYDILMYDCDVNTLIEDYEIDIFEDSTYTVTDSDLQ